MRILEKIFNHFLDCPFLNDSPLPSVKRCILHGCSSGRSGLQCCLAQRVHRAAPNTLILSALIRSPSTAVLERATVHVPLDMCSSCKFFQNFFKKFKPIKNNAEKYALLFSPNKIFFENFFQKFFQKFSSPK